jgi:AcrR family transcriptional regulator
MARTARAKAGQVRELAPRKLPRQERSRAPSDRLLAAAARLRAERPLAEITTNHIAERAGVGIGSLYEFFPNRDSVLATLLERRLERLLGEVRASVAEALALDRRATVELLVRRLVEAVTAERALFRVLLREAPHLGELSEIRRLRAAFFAFGGRGKLLPQPEADSWLISRMVANAVLEIALLDARAPRRELLVSELVRLLHRMVFGSD